MIKTVAYPRAALIGNPSDGYFGKTIAFVFKNFQAEVELEESQHLHIIPCDRDRMDFSSLSELANEISEFGYYGGVRLIKASLNVYCVNVGPYWAYMVTVFKSRIAKNNTAFIFIFFI